MTEDIKKTISRLVARFPEKESAILPILTLIHKEHGHVSTDDMDMIAGMMSVSSAKIFSAASYYSLINIKPKGKYNIQICNNVVCSLLDETHLLEHITASLGIRDGEITAGGLFSLSTVECLAACAYAPAIEINAIRYENVTNERFDEIVESIIRDERNTA